MVEGYLDGVQLRKLHYGIPLSRPAFVHLAATTPYFGIVGGRVLLTGLVGSVVVAAGANACQWVANPTTGTATQVLCAALDINPALVGDSLVITGIVANAMTYGGAGGLGAMAAPVLLLIGTLDFIAAAADASSTSWTLTYVPWDDGAYMTVL